METRPSIFTVAFHAERAVEKRWFALDLVLRPPSDSDLLILVLEPPLVRPSLGFCPPGPLEVSAPHSFFN
ncbi:hypothetical protein ONZ51_g2498 [Trametes cubensis]|uniref:Uncharacterized protein n=1 Tax=Trametes cubensis TaxID=1111947 RepID=A0AAD7TZJ0_9APHY|nr:hypothetical protein ONZ51_g2498 [Trametes cubensis]